MNIAQFHGAYLEKWLRELARLGYDTIIWEVENNIQWETCPECASPDAFTKDEFKKLLKLCSSLNLESIPLFQTFGHCEYVLKHPKYKHLAEMEEKLDQYCPVNPKLRPFLTRWIDEYLELFDGSALKYFHLGADEAWSLGKCKKCQDYVKKHSLAELYMQHVNFVAEPIIKRGITPIVWADMVLTHPEGLDLLNRKIMLFDWMYDIYRGQGKVWVWGKGFVHPEDLTPETLNVYGKYLYPKGDEPGREPEAFFNSGALAARGFKVVSCPGSSSYGDNVFSPRNRYHLINTYDSVHKGFTPPMCGAVLTSWTVHLFPWEMQQACIDLPEFIAVNPEASIDDFEKYFVFNRFGVEDDGTFMTACGLLSNSCLFTDTPTVGHNKSASRVPADHVAQTLAKLAEEEKLESELASCQKRLAEYERAVKLFDLFSAEARKGEAMLVWWRLAARNLVNRARASRWLISRALNRDADPAEAQAILTELRALRRETNAMYAPMIKPSRLAEYLHWLYDAVETALAG
jgi:hypothetical protein